MQSNDLEYTRQPRDIVCVLLSGFVQQCFKCGLIKHDEARCPGLKPDEQIQLVRIGLDEAQIELAQCVKADVLFSCEGAGGHALEGVDARGESPRPQSDKQDIARYSQFERRQLATGESLGVSLQRHQ